ncbi:Aste57867_8602 [Aphanomyces stellatus]|uniref:Lysosomal dipeptide transporter MFSD1 n=1 Tax=Aphanomyces stellatus TaxID=120398 RepID=A0A485KKQ1_9STRA|nr:hypothetical protein As57867_008570 [Aphanomyces stellatus]VFT85488.1 Aste57867_8602 [Aphanomyces stellatus]
MSARQETPLLEKAAIASPYFVRAAPAWKVWDVTSPSFRFYFLILLSVVPFAAHFVTNQMGALQQFMLDDATFPITNTMYGALNAAVAVPNMIIPFFGGHLMDFKGHTTTILCFLALMCIGHGVVVLAMSHHTFWLAVVGRIIYGLGGGSAIVGARVMVSAWFDMDITFAMGTMVAFTSVAKMLAKATVAPIAIHFGSYTYGLLYGLAICLVSCVVAGLVAVHVTQLKALKARYCDTSDRTLDPRLTWLNRYVTTERRLRTHHHAMPTLACFQEFPLMFWVLVILHVVYVQEFHLFENVSASYLYQTHGYSIVKSGFVSSLSHSAVLFAPVFGILIDRVGGRVPVILTSAALGILAYGLLLFTTVTPVVSLLLISVCLCATPTVLMACMPLTIPKSRYGLAFGIGEVVDAVGGASGNLVVGYVRDATGSYDAVMDLFFGLAWFVLLLCVLLACLDHYNGHALSKAAQSPRRVSVCDESDTVVDVARTLYESSSDEERGSTQQAAAK